MQDPLIFDSVSAPMRYLRAFNRVDPGAANPMVLRRRSLPLSVFSSKVTRLEARHPPAGRTNSSAMLRFGFVLHTARDSVFFRPLAQPHPGGSRVALGNQGRIWGRLGDSLLSRSGFDARTIILPLLYFIYFSDLPAPAIQSSDSVSAVRE